MISQYREHRAGRRLLSLEAGSFFLSSARFLRVLEASKTWPDLLQVVQRAISDEISPQPAYTAPASVFIGIHATMPMSTSSDEVKQLQ